LDGVIHLVGGFASGAMADETGSDEVERMLDLNYRSAITLARAVMPHLRKQRSGRFAAIGSRIVEAPAPLTAAYAASKAALVAWMRTLDVESAPMGVRVHVLLPDTLNESETARVTRELLEFIAS
ncbi:MAG: SDR family oxidoreductase, partial [Bryobacterales bacterium]|nr:SDR family oxidoreductase [Bryobacterales bacterium]